MEGDSAALADAIAAAARQQGATTPAVRGADWQTATVTAVDTPVGTVTCGSIVARRLAETYTAPAVGDLVIITNSGSGNWLAWGPASSAPATWTTLSLAAGFTNPGHGYTPGWLREGRRIWLRGRLGPTSGTIANGATLATLPAAIRPAGGVDMGWSTARSNELFPAVIRLDITTAGVLRTFQTGTLPTWVSLDGITYLTA